MPRETIDSILEPYIQEEEIDQEVGEEEEEEVSREGETFMFAPDNGSNIEVDLSHLEIYSMDDYHNSSGSADSYLEEEYQIVYLEDGETAHEEDTFICSVDESRYMDSYARTVSDRSGYEVSVHEDTNDLVYCEDVDETYIDSHAASSNGVEYCYNCEEHRHEDNHPYDCGENDESEIFDNSSMATKDTKNTKYSRGEGIKSATFSNMNGLRYTFGVEIETSGGGVKYDDVKELNMSAVNDGSISGKEYVTGVLVGDSGLSMLKNVCEVVKDNCQIDSQCGIHVHIGGAIFSRRFTIMATHLGLMLQDEIFDMMPSSRKTNTYCKPLNRSYKNMNFHNYKEHLADLIYDRRILDNRCNKKTDLGRYPSKRYVWLNMVGYSQASGHNTIEFRNHGASMNYDKIRNWTLICMAFVAFVENNQRRIWEAKDLPGGLTLSEVLNTSLGDNIGGQLSRYVNSRKEKFNGAS